MTLDDSLTRHRAFISTSRLHERPQFPHLQQRRIRPSQPEPRPPPPLSLLLRRPFELFLLPPPLPSLILPQCSHRPRLSLPPPSSSLLGGAPVATVLTVGLMAAYIIDSLSLKPAAFFAVWFTLLVAQIAFFASASVAGLPLASLPIKLLAVFLCAETTFLIGVWASLNFRWIQIENASIVPALERVLFACLPVTAPALFTWASVAAFGMASASYYHLAFACVFYWLFALPRSSSFHSKQDVADAQILGPLEGCLHMLHLLFVPVLFHIGSHHATIFSSALSVCDLLLLFFIPLLFVLYTSTRGALCSGSPRMLTRHTGSGS